MAGMVVLFAFVVISLVVFCLATLIAAIIDYETNYHDDDDPIGFLSSDPFYDIGDFYYWRWGLLVVAVMWLVLFLITLVGRCIDWSIYAGVHCGHYTSRAFCCWLFFGESFCRDCERGRNGRDRQRDEYYLEDAQEMRRYNIRRWEGTSTPPSQKSAATTTATAARAPGQLT